MDRQLLLRGVTLRLAALGDADRIASLIRESARGLGRSDYSEPQIEAALQGAWALDTQLLRDGTYFVAESTGFLVGCGGWSWRRTLFGGDAQPGRAPERLDPARDAARIRAFFVHPDWSRRGIARTILQRCEDAARAAGFRRTELMATLPGQRFYRAHGYAAAAELAHPLGGDLSIAFVPMAKEL